MTSHWKNLAVVSLTLSASVLMFVADAAAQMSRPMQPTGSQPCMMQPAMMKYGMMRSNQMQSGMMQSGQMQRNQMQPNQMPVSQTQTGTASPPRTAASHETYNLVEVGKELQVVSASGMKDLRKRIDDEYKAAQKTYADAKKDKNNKNVTLEKPEKKTIKTIKTGLKQDKAQEELQKLQAERDKNSGGTKKK